MRGRRGRRDVCSRNPFNDDPPPPTDVAAAKLYLPRSLTCSLAPTHIVCVRVGRLEYYHHNPEGVSNECDLIEREIEIPIGNSNHN